MTTDVGRCNRCRFTSTASSVHRAYIERVLDVKREEEEIYFLLLTHHPLCDIERKCPSAWAGRAEKSTKMQLNSSLAMT